MFGLSVQTIDSIQSLFSVHSEIEKVVIYGSRAKGNYRPGSDIDLTIFGKNMDASVLSKLLVELDELNTPYLMDVSIFDQIESKSMIDHIQRVGQVFYVRSE